MASTLGKVIQERNDKKNSQGRNTKASYVKTDAEFKKIFGLTKDLRVCLTRIPDRLGSGEAFNTFRSLVKSEKDTEFVVKEKDRKQVIDYKVSFAGTPERHECIFLIWFFSFMY